MSSEVSSVTSNNKSTFCRLYFNLNLLHFCQKFTINHKMAFTIVIVTPLLVRIFIKLNCSLCFLLSPLRLQLNCDIVSFHVRENFLHCI